MDDDDFLENLLDLHEETHVEPVDRQDIIRAPFTMPGCKRASLEFILPLLPYRKKWIEHFCGTGIMTLNREPSVIDVVNDRNSGIVAFYRCLKDKDKLQRLIEWTQMCIMSREDFYWCKETWCNEQDDVIRAGKWYYTVRQSVIGKGHCFGRGVNFPLKNRSLIALDLFPLIHHRMQNVLVENLDWEVCFDDFDSYDAVHYFDPPYIGTDTGIYADKWNAASLNRLLKKIETSKGFCALSGYPDDRIDNCDFWTERYEWDVVIHSEVTSFTEENHKMHRVNTQSTKDYAKEVLWVHNH